VGARESCASLADVADEVVCPFMPEPFRAVGLWYEHMPQASDEEVRHLLSQAWHEHARDLQHGRPASSAH
jgi:predicted phosphoribosyltransferase